MDDEPQHRTLPLTVRGLEVRQECEPEEATEANIDWSQPRRHQLEIDSGEEGPNTNSRLEEDNMIEITSSSSFISQMFQQIQVTVTIVLECCEACCPEKAENCHENCPMSGRDVFKVGCLDEWPAYCAHL